MITPSKKSIIVIVLLLVVSSIYLFNQLLKLDEDLIFELKYEYPISKLNNNSWLNLEQNELLHELSLEEITLANDQIQTNYVYNEDNENNEDNLIKACLLAVVLEDETMEGGGEEIKNLRYSIREIEDRFNSKYNYPYVILSPKPLSEKTMLLLSYLTKSKLKFGVIPYKHWSIPKDIDRQKARKTRKELNVIHADSLLFRHYNRYWTGFFFRHELTKDFDYYMKIDGGAQFNCDMKDPFEELKNNKKLYGFTQSVYELEDTIKSLWSVTKEHFKTINKKDLEFVSEDEGNTYNLCHYWNSFEVASFSVFRNQKYLDYFNELEKQGGIFYERWAEGPIKTLFLNFALNRNQIHFFDQIGFYKHPYQYCPKNQAKGENGKAGPVCACDPKFSSELIANTSCNLRWYNLTGWDM